MRHKRIQNTVIHVYEVTKKTTARLLNSDCNNVDVLLSIFSYLLLSIPFALKNRDFNL